LHQRYNGTVAMIMAIFWLLLYIVVNLMSILYLGALAISGISGFSVVLCIILLAVFSIIIALGGMKVIGYTDVIQVFFLILGGLVASYIALNLVSEKSGTTGVFNGLKLLAANADDHFHMIFHKENKNYMDLPGLSVLIGGLWITNLNYWGCNQYITQRALGADLKTARLAGKVNSIATIFTLDIYKKVIKPDASETNLVNLGKIAVVIAMVLGVILSLLVGDNLMGEGKQGFQYIQEYTGFVSPGILAMFLLGFFWRKATSNAALFATIGGFIFSVFFKFLPNFADLSFLASSGFSKANSVGIYEIPFLDRMGFVFILCVIGMYIISMIENSKGERPNALEVDTKMFRVTPAFTAGSLIICGLLVAIYSIWW
ncbi:MAG: sodium transporter, partial [Sphingobacteriaceae bacterium]